MSDIFSLKRGESPLVVSLPHSGESLGPYGDAMTDAAHRLADTDWHLPRLYGFLDDMGATILAAKHSRYVVDLNRDPSGKSLYPGQNVTELCPTTTFKGEPIYKNGQGPVGGQIEMRIKTYWQPYHRALQAEIERVKAVHGYVLLWDGHSIASRVPRFFEGRLPDINLGTNSGESCGSGLGEALLGTVDQGQPYRAVLNARFKGGYITRKYGHPDRGVHAVQLELSQITYMQEDFPFIFKPEKAREVAQVIEALMTTALAYVGHS